MKVCELGIVGAWVFTPEVHTWAAGAFVEPYSAPEFAEVVGHRLDLGHLNVSVAHAGTVRGVHFGDVPPGQAKYITCVVGSVWDVAVDLRVGSPTFGAWVGTLLDDRTRSAVYLSEGLGHGYISLEDHSTLVYVCSQPYVEGREHRINPLDPDLDIGWPTVSRDGSELDYVIGRKDRAAPMLSEALKHGILPSLASVLSGGGNNYLTHLREG
ncbi:dTDP-4-dehydrorhamnose 3,5-epimerase family protein [Paractinoplanes rishiriensis]|uniref:dTDP-4-dehydrorhamnose 3,5-epimerase RmlC n=1 Tax=Paractinoplanes rishiriensis TaxID=1050105 RepID=A0A919K5M9_9ACTN|nr:dTDP-4-dehydrorhamnose 3,5-epimerase [Actinoplanes rishiriensis]GIF01357.1 DTDP-4-dehydrorhamnose 3,5-epimerase RmlC [Actinoplanes rishiriensis]